MQVHQIFTANCLNPCCNGIYLIIQVTIENIMSGRASLNPCCNGIYLIIISELTENLCNSVLILVVMEYT